MVNGTCYDNQTAFNNYNITPYDPSTAPSYLVEPVTEYWEYVILFLARYIQYRRCD
jgi:hypothetical protein